MSLKHILNDVPSSPRSTAGPSYADSSHNVPQDPPRFDRASEIHAPRTFSHPEAESHFQAPSRSKEYHRTWQDPYQDRWGPERDPHFERWPHHRLEEKVARENDFPTARSVTPEYSQQSHSVYDDQDDELRKRRKVVEDTEYRPPGPKRAPRKSRAKAARSDNTASRDTLSVPVASRPKLPHKQSSDGHRLAGSDLEDCKDIWMDEINDYQLQSRRRLRQVEQWFNESMRERSASSAERISHYYGRKLADLPPPLPPSPPSPLPQSLPEQPTNGYQYPLSGFPTRFIEEQHFGSDIDNSETFSNIGHPKRPASGALSDASSDFDVPLKPSKRRRTAHNASRDASPATSEPLTLSAKGKGKAKQPLVDDASKPRKKPTPAKRKAAVGSELDIPPPSHAPSVSDNTPSISRPVSPVSGVTPIVYELHEEVPPLRKAKKMDDTAAIKRVRALEEAQRKVWTNIARKDVAKVYKFHVVGYQARQTQAERIAKLASIQARKPFTKTTKSQKETQTKARRLMREMQVFWKKNEREERDVRKRELKESMDKLKMEDEKREAARQARKLEFLISQTELYSHFVGSKLKTAEVEGDGAPARHAVPAGAELETSQSQELVLRDINFDDEDKTNLYLHARHNAQEAIAMAKQRAQDFDDQVALQRQANSAKNGPDPMLSTVNGAPTADTAPRPLVDLDSDELNFQNPTSLGQLTIQQPKMLMAQLKEYQLKGLNWLATLYDQGINGILADEMGLGKTVQSISLLSYLAETHDIWGPFLVVAPASTLHNWQQEITRFAPGLKALPYWGNVKDRMTLRKFWSKKEISYDQDAPFHVLITSYQLVIQDQQYFQRVQWQYMILDEAQNIKNALSTRWKTLLGFQCRNRLLLTGTPIQNSMQELWALLHFIMPSLFDSHDEFNEWFSKDIETAAENKGSRLNEYQLRRLHMILKPFMLRRVKRHVQNELSEKIEIDIFVELSARQRALYKALLGKVSVADLIARAKNLGDANSTRSLMNLVMQFRKVCNHPELFERADVVAPFSFTHFGRSGPLSREGDFINLPYSTRNPIEFVIPEAFYLNGGILELPGANQGGRKGCLHQLMNIWTPERIHHDLYGNQEESSTFSFLRLLDVTPQGASALHHSATLRRTLLAINEDSDALQRDDLSESLSQQHLYVAKLLLGTDTATDQPSLFSIAETNYTQSCLSRAELRWFIPPVVAPAISMYCRHRSFVEWQDRLEAGSLEGLALLGIPDELQNSEAACKTFSTLLPGVSPHGLIGNSPAHQLPASPMHVPEAKRLIIDSAKLARLDALLQELKAGDHRVLVYFQMTRMMDLMEEYLIYRQYKYLRLDGSSKIEDRRDMVTDWQTRPDIFVFLLSTRAGGLGINLTAADTVVFYDHDWNPSNDAQAMDRAHRLGQTRQVTVYRLITKGTIDERIIQLARVKKDVQDIVVGTKSFTDSAKPNDIMQLLLNDEQLSGLNESGPTANGLDHVEGEAIPNGGLGQEMWDDDEDFFGSNKGTGVNPDTGDTEVGPIGDAARGKKRKTGRGGGGRRPGAAGRKKGGEPSIA